MTLEELDNLAKKINKYDAILGDTNRWFSLDRKDENNDINKVTLLRLEDLP